MSTGCPALPTVTNHARIERATPAFRHTSLALFVAGYSTFALMYCVQPLLPELVRAFQVSPASSSLAVSVTMAALSATLLTGGAMLERVPRKSLIVAALTATAVLTLASALADAWWLFLLARALIGVALAGLPAIAMAYVGEELSRPAAGLGMGLYVAGTAVGGMSGRLVISALTDAYGWRPAVGIIGIVGLGAAGLVGILLPRASHPMATPFGPGHLLRIFTAHLARVRLRRLYAVGFLFMGVFVALYNYLTFHLTAPPFGLGQTAVGMVFLLYLLGMLSSPWAGAVSESLGHHQTLALSLTVMLVGSALTLIAWLPSTIAGLGLMTCGFFAAHAVTSTWIGLSADAHRAQASSLYLVFYYLGASVSGTIAGWFWTRLGWSGVVGLACVETVAALALLASMRRTDDVAGQR
jgi:YNFM family putative membrane transporter